MTGSTACAYRTRGARLPNPAPGGRRWRLRARNNPYRSVRYADPDSPVGYSFEPELYPNTRTTNAVGLRARYYLPYRAAVQADYRFFTDTWDIESHTAAISYV
ncbi:MAG TPA: DUF3570 domain-containing protein, partial [Woeseiaceae bacterium]|nr:DUF3570 domain-containing protein [Woeseiaceae bacterium]